MVKKINLYKNFNIKKNDKGSIILIGSFDGLHLGHRKLFERAKKLKSKTKLKIGVFTFDPIPKMFFSEKALQCPAHRPEPILIHSPMTDCFLD